MPTTEETQALVPVLPCQVRSSTVSASSSTHEEFCVPLKVTGSNGKEGDSSSSSSIYSQPIRLSAIESSSRYQTRKPSKLQQISVAN